MQRGSAGFTQLRGAFFHDAAIDLWHARGGRAFARAEGEGVDEREIARVNDGDEIGEVLLRLRWEAGDEVGAERDFRARGLHALAQLDRLRA